MLEIGLIIGIYAYSIFLLGLLGILYIPIIWLFTIAFVFGSFYYHKKQIRVWKNKRKQQQEEEKKDGIAAFLLLTLAIQAVINFVGVLGPELSFDALWYHLTLPKLYLMHHSISFIPGGLFYYSAMPKVLELLYTGGLAFGSAIFPKLIHFGFGILTLGVLYKISRKFLMRRMALLVLVVFYANLVVGWESISAYIDLGRTFFELLSMYAFLEWSQNMEKKWFFYSAIFIGLAIATKLLAIGSLVLLLILISLVLLRRKEPIGKISKLLCSYAVAALVVPLPWIVLSWVNTGNPFYPFFSHTYPVTLPLQLFNPFYFVGSFWNLLLYSADPLNPLYLMVLPLIIIFVKKWDRLLQYTFLYTIGGLFFWYITPHTGGGRFVLPYLPLLSLVSVVGFLSLKEKRVKQFLFIVAVSIAIVSIGYRAIANEKFLPVITGRESTSHFLATHLNFSFGDFVDSDGYFATHIKPTDTVLLYGFHNEYYVDFPFIDSSFVKKGDVFTYIAVQNGGLPKRFQKWNLVYTNPLTHVALYSIGGIPWVY